MSETIDRVQVAPYAKIRVDWYDKPENYSRADKNKIQRQFAKKYGLDRNKVKVIYTAVRTDEAGNKIKIEGADIGNIMDRNYQTGLMKEWLKRNDITIDFNRILELDNRVNNSLDVDIDAEVKAKWRINWLMLTNFLSFGPNNYFPIGTYQGLTVVNSDPANQGGKTTLVVDALQFLLFGNTNKTNKNEEVFNQFSDSDELVVRGSVGIEGEDDFIIERKMKRTHKKSGGWTINNQLNYYDVFPDGSENDKPRDEEDAIATGKSIREVIGKQEDFELVTLATSRNLDELVEFTTGEAGKTLTRFIGLDIIAKKERIVRDMWNDFSKKMKSNVFDVITLCDEIETHKANIETLESLESDLETKAAEEEIINKDLKDKRTELLQSKRQIDATVTSLNPSKLQEDIKSITAQGLLCKGEIEKVDVELAEIGEIDFDEESYEVLRNKIAELKGDIQLVKNTIIDSQRKLENLEESGICQACKRPLDDIDNTAHIEAHKAKIESDTRALRTKERKLEELVEEMTEMGVTKNALDLKSALEVKKTKMEVDMARFRTKLKDKKADYKNYKANLDAIEFNKGVDIQVLELDGKILVSDNQKNTLRDKLTRVQYEQETLREEIEKKEALIVEINEEKQQEIVYKTYIGLVGQKGISKLVLRSVLPIINSELERLLDEVVDFEVEVTIDDKNEVRFLIVKDGVEKLLKSASGLERTAASLALRSVLGRMSTLPMPNFIVFDEVLGRVAEENIDILKPLFDKIKDMYESVFFITHNGLVKDWADQLVTVVKDKNNISSIYAR